MRATGFKLIEYQYGYYIYARQFKECRSWIIKGMGTDLRFKSTLPIPEVTALIRRRLFLGDVFKLLTECEK